MGPHKEDRSQELEVGHGGAETLAAGKDWTPRAHL